MPKQIPSILYSSTQRLWPIIRALHRHGLDAKKIFLSAGLTERQIRDPDTRVPRDQITRLTATLIDTLSDYEDIGLSAATYFETTDFGLIGYICRHSEHLFGAMQRLSKYSRLIADAARCTSQLDERYAVIRIRLIGGRRLTPVGVDYALGSIFRVCSEITSERAIAISVRLARPLPKHPKSYHDFFAVPVQFDCQYSELVYQRDSALIPLDGYDPQLLKILEQNARSLISSFPAYDSGIEQIRSTIAILLEKGNHGLEPLADLLGMSARTLRRRLKEGGVGYRELLDQVRKDKALSLCRQGDLSVLEIAIQVGFDDPSAFARAFRRWTGISPSAYLNNLRIITATSSNE